MARQYSWKNVRSQTRRGYKKDDQSSRWIGMAIVLAVVSHGVVLFAMKKTPIFFDAVFDGEELATDQVVVRSVDARDYIDEPKEEEIEPPKTTEELLSELEMLEEAPKDMEVDFSPDVDDPEMTTDLEITALKGDVFNSSVDLTSAAAMTADAEDLGSTEDYIKPEKGQIVIDAGAQNADVFDPDKFNKELAKGAGGDDIDGSIDGFTPLSEMTRLSRSQLNKAKGMIGSDLLFAFGRAELRGSAKNSLMKVVLLIDKNPDMHCWIEGHTDLIGDEESNRVLSIERAEAVKKWLIASMQISPERLYVRGFGETVPIVKEGDQSQQAINRRVEIKMRNKRPPEYDRKPRIIKPKINPNLPENQLLLENEASGKRLAEPKKKPMEKVIPKAIPVDDIEQTEEEKVMPARSVELPKPIKRENNTPPKAIPVEPIEEQQEEQEQLPAPPKAIPVE